MQAHAGQGAAGGSRPSAATPPIIFAFSDLAALKCEEAYHLGFHFYALAKSLWPTSVSIYVAP